MIRVVPVLLGVCLTAFSSLATPWPGPVEDGYLLPNGWRITPLGSAVETHDLVLNLSRSPDGRVVVATHGGFNPHGLVVLDGATGEAVQRIKLPSAWYGLAWDPSGATLYVAGGNNKNGVAASIYVFDYADGRLSDHAVEEFVSPLSPQLTFWAGLACHPTQPLLYAASRTANRVFVFHRETREVVGMVETEYNPYDLVLSPDGATLYCTNWGSDSLSIIDTATMTVRGTIPAGDNPNQMALSPDGWLFVCAANDNAVRMIDTRTLRTVRIIETSLFPNAPEGSTPNALALDPARELLYVANADNNNVCVVALEPEEDEEEGEAEDVPAPVVMGFLPVGWYPSALALDASGERLFVGNSKGLGSYSNVKGPSSPLRRALDPQASVKSLQRGSVNCLDLAACQLNLRAHTRQAYANAPYTDEMLTRAKAPEAPSVVPREVGKGSPIEHVIYIIKENRTYDQVFGDLPQGNGDPRLCIFGREITPNHHRIAEQFVLFDNLYCDAEVSWDGHQWSTAAYATDFTEKYWPASYGGHSQAPLSPATVPKSGYIWDECFRKGLTYRSYGEFAERVSEEDFDPLRDADATGEANPEGGRMGPAHPNLAALHGHVAPHYLCWDARDTENAAEFIREFDAYEAQFDNPDPAKRLPNFIIMSLPEDHTYGATPGRPTVRACVASNDYALGLILERVSQSRYWPKMAVFTIEDDAQAGPDHVDARRTVGLVASPYARRGIVDSTLYTTSSVLRTIELLLGLRPMSQYDAAATPMYAAFTDTPDTTPYEHLDANVDLEERNEATAWGADKSKAMDFSIYDRAPMAALNEIIWKNMRGADAQVPVPVSRFHLAAALATAE